MAHVLDNASHSQGDNVSLRQRQTPPVIDNDPLSTEYTRETVGIDEASRLPGKTRLVCGIGMQEDEQLIAEFGSAITRRVRAEESLRELSMSVPDQQERQLLEAWEQAQKTRQTSLEESAAEFEKVTGELNRFFETERSTAETEHRQKCDALNRELTTGTDQLERQHRDSAWVVNSVLDDDSEESPRREYEKFKSQVFKTKEDQTARWEALESQLIKLAEAQRRDPRLDQPAGLSLRDRDAAAESFNAHCESATQAFAQMSRLMLPKLFLGFRPLILLVALTVLFAVPAWMFLDPAAIGVPGGRMEGPWLGVAAGIGAGASIIFCTLLYTMGAMQQAEIFHRLRDDLAVANASHQRWLALARTDLERFMRECEEKQERLVRERDKTLKRYEETLEERLGELRADHEKGMAEEAERYRQLIGSIEETQAQHIAEVTSEYEARVAEITGQWDPEIERLTLALQQSRSDKQRRQAEEWMALKSDWEASYEQFQSQVNQRAGACQKTFRPWDELVSGGWQPGETIPREILLGHYDLDLSQWPGAVSNDMRLEPSTTSFSLPATIPFPNGTSLLLKAHGSGGRAAAVPMLQSAMLRLLTLLPPGKVRFTMIDPVGLGESFAGFMHLADFDELMVSNRIWTESGHIEARLADLTEHMENVLQKYLRNEFATIEDYNTSAGEVAEPYHFLVITDFPSKFSEIAARRLVSIVNSGPRCGVYTLMSIDTSKSLPNNFELADITAAMQVFEERDGTWHAAAGELSRWPLVTDPPPSSETFTSLVRIVGEASKDARRVEVAFDRIAPDPGHLWERDSRHGLEVPLGRAGATKLQQLQLGRGTSQHMLVAGKTGSGKSTFLHILITNLALYYGPDEVNFFLIDFKKGVEFKDYATGRLPHARVIAVESDREFGVSALQKLDAVLQERGETFRRHGVQDIAGFREANPNTPMPRILLVVDEFQEFFVEDDKLSQSAALLLDRLVRQGRAFGIHVVLGSQTLGGAYSLARSTLGQVAVRVALQCSESDAHLILSEENTAARLLTRPGEAIYNDANGLLEGNHPFQIAWLSDEQRSQSLREIRARTDQQGIKAPQAIVFEGNIPSDLTHNEALQECLAEFAEREAPVASPTLWFGDAVEIKEPTSLTLHRETGRNLLLVGADAEAAAGVMSAAALAVAATGTKRAEAESIWLLNGSPADMAESQYWKAFTTSLPNKARTYTPRQSVEAIEALAAEKARREADPDVLYPPIVVFVYHLAKFRDLRKAEDDFGFGGFGGSTEPKPAAPGKTFTDLIASGPEWGIHFVVWVDSYTNVERWLGRQVMREFELRIAFQLNAADSSNFIDSPAASRLGTHRALLYREESGTIEKFRPYGMIDSGWMKRWGDDFSKLDDDGDVATDLEEFQIL